MALMKGSAFTARFAYLRAAHPDRWDELVAALSAETQALARGPCLKGSWYPFASFVDLNVQADRLFGKGDLALARELGRDAAKVNMPALYRLFYKIGSVEYALDKIASAWRQHHDSGRLEMTMTPSSPPGALVRLVDFAAPHPALCRSLEGFFTGSLELMRMNDVKVVEVRCRTRGAKVCEWSGTWKPR
jgi:predicted hydrocarbon binding protein